MVTKPSVPAPATSAVPAAQPPAAAKFTLEEKFVFITNAAIISGMRGVVLYHPNSEHTGIVLDYVRDYKNFKGKDLELLSLETVQGSHLAELYDITSYPAILAMSDECNLQKFWQGLPLPLMNEVDAYLPDYAMAFARARLLSQAEV